MWGFAPAESAIKVKDFFIEEKLTEILIPGIGYGRNAKIFLENGINVTGIEISETAIRLARSESKLEIQIYHGSVAKMPFDSKQYDGIFSYALIHLFNSRERKKFISNCYNQLKYGGYMFFSTISKKDSLYEKGKPVSKDRIELMNGAKVFFYDAESIKKEFEKYGLMDFSELDEPVKFDSKQPPMKFTMIKCKKMPAANARACCTATTISSNSNAWTTQTFVRTHTEKTAENRQCTTQRKKTKICCNCY